MLAGRGPTGGNEDLESGETEIGIGELRSKLAKWRRKIRSSNDRTDGRNRRRRRRRRRSGLSLGMAQSEVSEEVSHGGERGGGGERKRKPPSDE